MRFLHLTDLNDSTFGAFDRLTCSICLLLEEVNDYALNPSVGDGNRLVEGTIHTRVIDVLLLYGLFTEVVAVRFSILADRGRGHFVEVSHFC